jgi:hypothetical protein
MALELGLMPKIGPAALGNPMLILVAAFVVYAGQAELGMVRRRAAARRAGAAAGPVYVNTLPRPDEDSVPVLIERPEAPSPDFSGLLWNRQAGLWVVWQDGRPVAAVVARAE